MKTIFSLLISDRSAGWLRDTNINHNASSATNTQPSTTTAPRSAALVEDCGIL